MASVNPLSRELVFKIVYYGPGLGGKTTTLEHLHATAKPEHRGKLVSLATPVDRTLYFDFLPVRLPPIRNMSVRLQLFTVPGQVYFNATRKLVLTGADGVVFVSDSQRARADANLESLENLRENLAEQGRELAKMPLVFQHNKRDLAEICSVEELEVMLNPFDAPAFATCAKTGDGIYETLDRISERVLRSFEGRLTAAAGRTLDASLEVVEGGLATALRDASPPDSVRGAVVARIDAPSPIWSSIPPGNASVEDGSSTRTLRTDPELIPTPLEEASAIASPEAHAARLAEPASTVSDGSLQPGASTSSKPRPGLSFAELWPDAEQELVREIEISLAMRRYGRAVELCDAMVSRIFASAASLFGSVEAPREPALLPILLGLDGRRYMAFRRTVREARGGGHVDAQAALTAYVFAVQARIARSTV